jgi:transmembrane sensor
MKTKDTQERARDVQGQQRAWDALGALQDHPKISQWLQEAEESRAARAERSHAKRWTLAASIAVVAAGIGTAAWFHFAPERYETTVGEQRDVVMEDGSRITLNTSTKLAVRYTKDRRYIEMSQGEALFSVKNDAQRPFDVVAGGTLTRALGTEFNVDLRNTRVTVSVLDGAVRVMGTPTAKKLAALDPGSAEPAASAAEPLPATALGKGRALEFRRKEHRTREDKADLKRIEAWRTRRLEFSDTPLSAAVEEFNRYSTLRVVVGTPALGEVRVSGVFRIGDVDSFLYTLREALNVETHEATGEVVLLRKAE